MTTIVSLLKDKAGLSSTKMALLIGLTTSAVLGLLRIGVAAAGQ
jgi:predicted transcriptional regulator